MYLMIMMGALNTINAPVNAPISKGILITIFSLGCMRCIESLHNIAIILQCRIPIWKSHAPNVPGGAAYRKIAFSIQPPMHPRLHWILARCYRWMHEVHYFRISSNHFRTLSHCYLAVDFMVYEVEKLVTIMPGISHYSESLIRSGRNHA